MRIMYLGDIHGNFNLISQYVKRFGLKDTHIIQVGDFGVGYNTLVKEKRYLEMFNTELAKKNVIVWAIRGNHDFKPYFDNDPFELSNIKLVKDYTVLNLEGNNILCIGGAVSVDRKLTMTDAQKEGDFTTRAGRERWWNDEIFVLDDNALRDLRDINIVVTHTCPDYCFPDNGNGFGAFVDGYIKYDPDLKLDLMDERRQVSLAFQTIKMNNDITHHYYGHFHRSETTNMFGTKHRLLGVGELWEEK